MYRVLPERIIARIEIHRVSGIGIRLEHGNFRCVRRFEINSGTRVEPAERLPDCRGQNLPYRRFVFEFYFVFGRMDIDVDGIGLNSEIDEIIRLAVGRYQRFLTAHYGLVEIGMTHVTPVDREILQRVPASRMFRPSEEAVYTDQ